MRRRLLGYFLATSGVLGSGCVEPRLIAPPAAPDHDALLIVRFQQPQTIAAFDSVTSHLDLIDHVSGFTGWIVAVHGDSIDVRVRSITLRIPNVLETRSHLVWRPEDRVPPPRFVRFAFRDAALVRYYGDYDEARLVAGVIIYAAFLASMALIISVPICVLSRYC